MALLSRPRGGLPEPPRRRLLQGADCGVSKSFSSRSEADTGRYNRLARRSIFFDITAMDPDPAHAAEDLWVFAYGSLMWRPDFPFVERVEARLLGAHRALCVYSFVHRGTPERPGLVLGLDRGGTCRGIAYRVAAKERARHHRLSAGARAGDLRLPRIAFVRSGSSASPSGGCRGSATWWIVGTCNTPGGSRSSNSLHHVRQGHGQSGANRDYVIATVGALEQLGYRETELHLLAARLAGTHEASASSMPPSS